jgi:hypothetical protein
VTVDEGAAELPVRADLDPAAELRAQGLLAVADAEHRHAELQHGRQRLRRVRLDGRRRAARKDHGLGRKRPDRSVVHRARQDLAVEAGLAYAARDQLRVLSRSPG